MKKRKKLPEPKPKVLVIRVTLTEAQYAEARQFYTRKEIVEIIREAGLSELSELVDSLVEKNQREEMKL